MSTGAGRGSKRNVFAVWRNAPGRSTAAAYPTASAEATTDIDALRAALKSVAATESFGKSYAWHIHGGELAKKGQFLKASKVLKAAGPAADVFGVVSEGMAAQKSADENNEWNTAWHAVGAAGSGLSSVGGILVLSVHPATVAVGAAMLLVGTGLSIGSEVFVGKDFIRGEDGPAIAQLKKMALLRNAPEEVRAYNAAVENLPDPRGRLRSAELAYKRAGDVLDGPNVRADRALAQRASDARWNAAAEMSRLEKSIADAEQTIARAKQSFTKKGIDPAVWDGHDEYLRNQQPAQRK